MDRFEMLLEGWGKAFGESGLVEEHRKKAVVMKYSRDEGFDLEDYVPGSGGRGVCSIC